MESTRAQVGLHLTDMLVGVDETTGKLYLIGEINQHGELCSTEEDGMFEVWQSPAELRTGLRTDFMRDVVEEMIMHSSSWSIATAARAIFRDAAFDPDADKDQMMAEVEACWSVDPICTSIVIIFWQRYICKLVSHLNAGAYASNPLHPCDLVMKFMPLKADRGLPGDLAEVMREHGWTNVTKMDKAHHPQQMRKDFIAGPFLPVPTPTYGECGLVMQSHGSSTPCPPTPRRWENQGPEMVAAPREDSIAMVPIGIPYFPKGRRQVTV
jgi:hypothetical protein